MADSMKPEMSLQARIEALLFVTAAPTTVQQLATALEIDASAAETGLIELEAELRGRGLRLQRHAGGLQLTTAPEVAALVERFLGLDATAHLGRAALETLAIVAYRQPVTRPQVDSIRGVNSDTMLRSLLHKGLVSEAGRAEGPGRPILYTTSFEFLQHFGLNSLSELPELVVPGDDVAADDMLKG